MAQSPIPATGVGWNTAIPDIGCPHGNDYAEHQETKLAVSLRSNKEHVAYGVDTAGGEHKPGSALSYFGDFSVSAAGDALPTRRPDAAAPWTSGGTALTAADYGRLAYDSDAVFGGILYQYTATGWVALGYVNLLTAQTIAGVKTFQSLPKVLAAEADWGAESTDNPDDAGNRVPTDDTELTPKKYVDDSIAATMTPAVYAGEESITFNNGMIYKAGKIAGSNPTVTFAAAFPTALISVVAVPYGASSLNLQGAIIKSESVSGFTIDNNESTTTGYYWMAMGR